MSGQSNNNSNRRSPNPVAVIGTVAAAVGFGAIAAVGAYLLGKEHAEEEAAAAAPAAAACAAKSHDMNSWGAGTQSPTNSDTTTGGDSDKNLEDERDCKICMRSFEEIKTRDEEIHTTQCGHVFCEKCINTCIGRTGQCPICKHGIRFGETTRIYL